MAFPEFLPKLENGLWLLRYANVKTKVLQFPGALHLRNVLDLCRVVEREDIVREL